MTENLEYTSPDFRESETHLKPFIKWAGGKKQLLPDIKKVLPDGFGSRITKYAEPFIGGGAVLFEILSTFNLSEIYISDINEDLITTYQVVRDKPEELISHLKEWETAYRPLSEEKRKEYYYDARTRFNRIRINNDPGNVELASLFIFLNRTCFNGLYRVSPKTGFNVPMGGYKNPKILNEENLRNISEALKTVEIVHGSFEDSEPFIDSNTFVYFDPPYRPLSETSSFTSYAETDFTDNDQKSLATYFRHLDKKGAKLLLSNSDPKNTNPNDTFFDDLYAGFTIRRVEASRMINSNAAKRGKISELLISNY